MKLREFWEVGDFCGIGPIQYKEFERAKEPSEMFKVSITHFREVSPAREAAIQKMVEVLEFYSICSESIWLTLNSSTKAFFSREKAIEILEAWRKANE